MEHRHPQAEQHRQYQRVEAEPTSHDKINSPVTIQLSIMMPRPLPSHQLVVKYDLTHCFTDTHSENDTHTHTVFYTP